MFDSVQNLTVSSFYEMTNISSTHIVLVPPNIEVGGNISGTYLSNYHDKELQYVSSLPVRCISIWDGDLVLYVDDWYPFMGKFS